ncbi:hypothetical protein J9K13_002720 [Salmonella enterica]|nr:hypothetical protein [Salmonella enterica]HEC8456382.1 hypothetical protein [Salmonella enterica subsp. enterica serovar Poona]
MRQECIRQVTQAAGRALTQAEIKGIEDRISAAHKRLAQNNPDWLAKSREERFTAAAKVAAEQLEHEAQLKKFRVAKTILARKQVDDFVSEYIKAGGKGGRLGALNRMIAFKADAQANFPSIESRYKALSNYSVGRLFDQFSKAQGKNRLLWERKENIHEIIRAMFGEKVENPEARKTAEVWHETAEFLRRRFNAEGGQIGKLENWALPQQHSQEKVAKAGPDQWIADVIGKLDRSKYVHEDGRRFTDAEMKKLLDQIHETIATGGMNKLSDSGAKVSSMLANRHADSRKLFFKDAQSWIDYQEKYGTHNLQDIMTEHIQRLSRDIATLETFGPNPDYMFRSLLNDYSSADARNNRGKAQKVQHDRNDTENLYNYVSGKTLPVGNRRLAEYADFLRQWLISSRLGSALLSSFSDAGTMRLLGKVNNLPQMQLWGNTLRGFNPADADFKRLARRSGLGLDSVIGDINRFGMGTLAPSKARVLSNAVMRASGLNYWTDAHKTGFGTTMMSAYGHLVKTFDRMDKLDPQDHKIARTKADQKTWDIWRMAEQEDWGGGNDTMLTPESIMRIDNRKLADAGYKDPEGAKLRAMQSLLGAVLEETDLAVTTPGMRDQYFINGQFRRGTVTGELARSVMLFKSFPISFARKHWARASAMDGRAGVAKYMASLMVSTTLLGALAYQAKQLANGNNPDAMDTLTFWQQALLQGGGLGLYGDFLLADHTRYGSGAFETFMGPVLGEIDDVIKILQGIPVNAVDGKPQQTGGDVVKLIKGLTPFGNLWYTKAVTNHLIFNQAQEWFSPGYLERSEARAKQQFHTSYWWAPHEMLPGG